MAPSAAAAPRIAERLWDEHYPLALGSLYSPFVQALADDTLPITVFQSYVSQDWNYLDAFFSSFSQAYERCPPEQHEVVSRLKTLMEGTKEEMNLHAGYAKRWGVDLGAPIKLNPACTAYCTFLKSTAADPKTTIPEILAAMLPCAQLYGFIGRRLAASRSPDRSEAVSHLLPSGRPDYAFASGRYHEWVETYDGAPYWAVVGTMAAVLELTAGEADQARLAHLYATAMKLERAFFDAYDVPAVAMGRIDAIELVTMDDALDKSAASTASDAGADGAAASPGRVVDGGLPISRPEARLAMAPLVADAAERGVEVRGAGAEASGAPSAASASVSAPPPRGLTVRIVSRDDYFASASAAEIEALVGYRSEDDAMSGSTKASGATTAAPALRGGEPSRPVDLLVVVGPVGPSRGGDGGDDAAAAAAPARAPLAFTPELYPLDLGWPLRTGSGSGSSLVDVRFASSWAEVRSFLFDSGSFSFPLDEALPGAGLVGLPRRLWERSTDLAEEAYAGAYVQGVLRGDLPRASRLSYDEQGLPFMVAYVDFARDAARRTLAAAPELYADASFVLRASETMLAALSARRAARARSGLLPEAAERADPATLAYVAALRRSARHSLAGAWTALAPCCRLYRWIGRRLVRDVRDAGARLESLPDADWIEHNVCLDTVKCTTAIERLVEALGAGLPDQGPR